MSGPAPNQVLLQLATDRGLWLSSLASAMKITLGQVESLIDGSMKWVSQDYRIVHRAFPGVSPEQWSEHISAWFAGAPQRAARSSGLDYPKLEIPAWMRQARSHLESDVEPVPLAGELGVRAWLRGHQHFTLAAMDKAFGDSEDVRELVQLAGWRASNKSRVPDKQWWHYSPRTRSAVTAA